MQVNKHLHRGTAFVSWSAQETSSSSSPSPANKQESGPRAFPIRPVRWHVKPRIQASRARQKETTRPKKKAQKRVADLGAATFSTSDRDEAEAGGAGADSREGGLSLSSECIFPVWASAVLPEDLPDSHKRLLHLTVVYWPIIAYPLGEHALLSYNPLQAPGWYMFLF